MSPWARAPAALWYCPRHLAHSPASAVSATDQVDGPALPSRVLSPGWVVPCPRTSWWQASRAALGWTSWARDTGSGWTRARRTPCWAHPSWNSGTDFPGEQMKGGREEGKERGSNSSSKAEPKPQPTVKTNIDRSTPVDLSAPLRAGIWKCIRPRPQAGSSLAVWELTRAWGIPAPPALPLRGHWVRFWSDRARVGPHAPDGATWRLPEKGAGRPPTSAPVCSQEAGWGGERHPAASCHRAGKPGSGLCPGSAWVLQLLSAASELPARS